MKSTASPPSVAACGGFVITRDRLDSVIPVMNTAMEGRTQVEWDKDDLESLGILKIDILALGMLTCLRKAFGLLEDHYALPMTLASMEKENKRTYAMIQRADTISFSRSKAGHRCRCFPA
ncbi:MAG: hypothetical protein R3D34_02275 [Nitratireductor sp.]